MTGLRTSEAARVLGVSPNTLRAWERRGLVAPERMSEDRYSHRRYDRVMVLALRDAMAEGLSGQAMLERAAELRGSARYREPRALTQRMDRLEAQMRRVAAAVEELVKRG